MKRATLTLDDGTQFVGWHFGFPSSSSGEVGKHLFHKSLLPKFGNSALIPLAFLGFI